MNNTVIYTAITKGYDNLRDPQEITPKCDYVCFTNNSFNSNVWKIKKFDEMFIDATRTAKKPKILPHRYFKDYKYSVWVDGNMVIKKDLTPILNLMFKGADLGFFSHPENRNKLSDELNKCIELKKDSKSLMRDQVESYYKKGYKDSGKVFPACFIIFRKHNDKNIINAMEMWWNEIDNHSKRDQLSFSYIAWKNNLKFKLLDHDEYFGQYFERLSHGRFKLVNLFKTFKNKLQ